MHTIRERVRSQELNLTPPDAPQMRVVLAGFDPMGRRAIHGAATGAELLSAPDADTLHRTLREPVDAVVCDARAEPAAALAALVQVRERDWALPVLMLVSRLDSETAAEAHRLGATSILRAPFTAVDVVDAVSALRS